MTPKLLEAMLIDASAPDVYAIVTGNPRWADGMRRYVPPHMQSDVVRWVAFGRWESLCDFLLAAFSNDLLRTVDRADDINRRRIPDWVVFMYNYMPSSSFGSMERVKAWKGTHSS